MVKEEIEVLRAAKERVATFSVENSRVLFTHQGCEFEVGKRDRIAIRLIERADHFPESWDEVLGANEDLVVVFNPAKINNFARVFQFVRVAFPEVKGISLKGVGMIPRKLGGHARGVEAAGEKERGSGACLNEKFSDGPVEGGFKFKRAVLT